MKNEFIKPETEVTDQIFKFWINLIGSFTTRRQILEFAISVSEVRISQSQRIRLMTALNNANDKIGDPTYKKPSHT